MTDTVSRTIFPPQRAAELYYSAEVVYQPGWKLYPRFLPSSVLYYAQSGSGTYSIDGVPYPVKAGECFWIPPNSMFSLNPIEKEAFAILQFRFLIHDPELHQQLQMLLPPVKVDNSLRAMLLYLFNHWNDSDAHAQARVDAFSVSVLSLLFANQPDPGGYGSTYLLTEGYHLITKKTIRYVEDHFYSPYSLEDIAQSLGYNKNYLCTLFTQDVGVSIKEYANIQRIRLAAVFFFDWAVSMAQTCELLRFNSFSYFSRLFKRYTGVPPGEFSSICNSLSPEERSHILNTEDLIKCRRMSISDLSAALLHFGSALRETQQEKHG